MNSLRKTNGKNRTFGTYHQILLPSTLVLQISEYFV